MLNSILVILCLIAVSAFFSISEISLAASRKIKLKLLADEGNINASRILKMQENPGMFFTVVQIGLNAVAILGGIVGDAAFSPALKPLLLNHNHNGTNHAPQINHSTNIMNDSFAVVFIF